MTPPIRLDFLHLSSLQTVSFLNIRFQNHKVVGGVMTPPYNGMFLSSHARIQPDKELPQRYK